MKPTSLRVSLASLPDDEQARESYLQAYFGERVVACKRATNGWVLTLRPYPSADYYVDPQLDAGLRWWDPELLVADIPFAWRDMAGWFISLNDAWGLMHWSRWLRSAGAPAEVVIIHVDDHDDLMSPRIGVNNDSFVDLCTGREVDLRDPASVAGAIESGAIGQGSFLVPLLHSIPITHIRHLCAGIYSNTRAGYNRLIKSTSLDGFLDSSLLRPVVNVGPGSAPPGASSYLVTRSPGALLAGLPSDLPILVHIDMDYFNNRFNGDSDFREFASPHDPPFSDIEHMMDHLIDALRPIASRIVSVVVGVSPGFFPAELWAPAMERLGPRLDELVSEGGGAL